MKNKYLLIIFLVALVGFTISCSKDYYDTKQAGEDFLADNLKRGSVDLYETKYDTTIVNVDTTITPRQVFYKNVAVNELKSGVQYAVYWTDPNGMYPLFTDAANLNIQAKYKISFIDGTEFKEESTENVALGSNLTFWQTVIPKMKVGSKWRVWVPYTYAYGTDGSKNGDNNYIVDPYTVLVYDIELISAN